MSTSQNIPNLQKKTSITTPLNRQEKTPQLNILSLETHSPIVFGSASVSSIVDGLSVFWVHRNLQDLPRLSAQVCDVTGAYRLRDPSCPFLSAVTSLAVRIHEGHPGVAGSILIRSGFLLYAWLVITVSSVCFLRLKPCSSFSFTIFRDENYHSSLSMCKYVSNHIIPALNVKRLYLFLNKY